MKGTPLKECLKNLGYEDRIAQLEKDIELLMQSVNTLQDSIMIIYSKLDLINEYERLQNENNNISE